MLDHLVLLPLLLAFPLMPMTLGSHQAWDFSAKVSISLSLYLSLTHAHTVHTEDDEGNVEYKWKLIDPSEERFEKLVTQMKFRLAEGTGEAFYEVGVEDTGFPRG